MHTENSKEHKSNIATAQTSQVLSETAEIGVYMDLSSGRRPLTEQLRHTPGSNLQPGCKSPQQKKSEEAANLCGLQAENQPSQQQQTKTSVEIEGANSDNHVWAILSSEDQELIFQTLSRSCHSASDLLRNGYRIEPMTKAEVGALCKCKDCGCVYPILVSEAQFILTLPDSRKTIDGWRFDKSCSYHPGKGMKLVRNDLRLGCKNLRAMLLERDEELD